MRSFIHDYMDEVFKEFTSSIDGKCLCELKNNRYDKQAIPDYSKLNEQLFYLLRYFPAYLSEYKYLYSLILSERLVTRYNVLSIGCGSAIDYYGLYFAAHMDISTINYKGIDPVNWKYRKDLGNQNFLCMQKSITELKFITSGYNIIFFPKSLSEIPEDALSIFLTNIEQGDFTSKIIYLVSSTMDTGFIHDQRKYERIKDSLIKIGFACDNYQTTKEIAKKPSFAHFDPQFFYPDEVKDFILELNKKCPTYFVNGQNCDNTCKEQLARYPILKTTHVSFQINKFERD